MTERERWVVYPLLFLALGAALRDKFVDPTIAKRIYCRELAIVDDETSNGQFARVLARIGRDEVARGRAPSASFMLNGRMEVSSEDASGVHPHVSIGRTDASPGAPSYGEVLVDGVVNANQYLVRDLPFMPPLRVPVTLDQLRALQQTQKQQKVKPPAAAPKSRDPQTPPPVAKQPEKTDSKASPPAPADEKGAKQDAPK